METNGNVLLHATTLLNDLSIREKYYSINQNQFINFLSYAMEKIRIAEITEVTNKKETICFEIDKTSTITQNTFKLLAYAIHRLKYDNKVNFSLSDYCQFIGVDSARSKKQTAKRIKQDLLTLSSIKNTKYIYRKTDLNINSIITQNSYNRGSISIEFDSKFAESINCNNKQFTYFPKELFKFNMREEKHAFILGYYFYEYARNNPNRKGQFNLNVNTCLNRLVLPKYDTVLTRGRHYNREIIVPFIRSLNLLKDKLNIIAQCKNKIIKPSDFFENQILINLNDNFINTEYSKLNNERISDNIKFNKERKHNNINKAKILHSQGMAIKEIAIKINKSEKTIKRYLGGITI